MKQLLFLFLFLLPCLAWAQYLSNGNQKITLGEQTTADGLIYRGVAATDTVRKPSIDTMAYMVLDTTTNIMWHYKKATSNAWLRVGGSISSGLTGVLPVANGGTGASSFSPNNYLIRTNSSGIFDTASIYEANGNVGVGNSSPNFKLDVTGTGRFTGALTATSSITGAAITLTGTTGYGYISDANSFRRIWFENEGSYRTLFDLPSSGTNFSFRNNTGTILATIASTGVATYSSVIGTSFEVGNGQYYKARRNSGGLLIDLLGIESGTDDTRLLITGDYNIKDCCSTLFKLTSAGAVTIKNLAGATSGRAVLADINGVLSAPVSSINTKENVQTLNYGLNELLQINPVSFDYINKDKWGEERNLGFIVEDMFPIIPEVTGTMNNGDMYLDMTKLIPVLTKAMQEQQALIKALEQRIINLENK
jgi:hypothetical protein